MKVIVTPSDTVTITVDIKFTHDELLDRESAMEKAMAGLASSVWRTLGEFVTQGQRDRR